MKSRDNLILFRTEPDNYYNIEGCIAVRPDIERDNYKDGTIYDDDCRSRLPSVCESNPYLV
jgi:hypothetical protein